MGYLGVLHRQCALVVVEAIHFPFEVEATLSFPLPSLASLPVAPLFIAWILVD